MSCIRPSSEHLTYCTQGSPSSSCFFVQIHIARRLDMDKAYCSFSPDIRPPPKYVLSACRVPEEEKESINSNVHPERNCKSFFHLLNTKPPSSTLHSYSHRTPNPRHPRNIPTGIRHQLRKMFLPDPSNEPLTIILIFCQPQLSLLANDVKDLAGNVREIRIP